NATLTNPGPTPAPQSRNANSLVFEDTLSWLKGSHSVTGGVSYTQYDTWAINSMLVPQLRFSVLASDPANAMFNATNFPGASTANLTAASNLYALLTGRINQISGDARIDESTGEYKFVGPGKQTGRLREGGLFVQDS